jgi:hypothetical protein
MSQACHPLSPFAASPVSRATHCCAALPPPMATNDDRHDAEVVATVDVKTMYGVAGARVLTATALQEEEERAAAILAEEARARGNHDRAPFAYAAHGPRR